MHSLTYFQHIWPFYFSLIFWLTFNWKLYLIMVPTRWDYCTFQYVVILISYWYFFCLGHELPTNYEKAQKTGTWLDKGLWSLGKFLWRQKTGKLFLHFSKRWSEVCYIAFQKDLHKKIRFSLIKTASWRCNLLSGRLTYSLKALI